MKLSYFHKEWKDRPEWITLAEKTVDDVWKTCYRGYGVANPVPVLRQGAEDPSLEEGNLSRWERKRLVATQLAVNVDIMTSFQQQHRAHRVKDDYRYWFDQSQNS